MLLLMFFLNMFAEPMKIGKVGWFYTCILTSCLCNLYLFNITKILLALNSKPIFLYVYF